MGCITGRSFDLPVFGICPFLNSADSRSRDRARRSELAEIL